LDPVIILVGFNVCLLSSMLLSRLMSKSRWGNSVFRKFLLFCSVFLLISLLAAAPAQATVITENSLAGDPRPWAIVVGGDDYAYFTERYANKIGRMSSGGYMDEWSTPAPTNPEPYGIAVDPTWQTSYVWFTEAVENRIGMVSGGTFYKWSCGANPYFIVYDPWRGYSAWNTTAYTYAVWFTEYGANKIGRLDVYTSGFAGSLTEFALPSPNSKPFSIAISKTAEHVVWFTEQGSPSRIGCLNPETRMFKEYQLSPKATPWGIAVDPFGTVWFTYTETDTTTYSYIAKLNPGNGQITAYGTPTPNSDPRDILVDVQGNVWFTEHGAKKIGKYVPSLNSIIEYPVPSGGAPQGIAVRRDYTSPIWFTEPLYNRIGMLTQPAGPTTTVTATSVSFVSTTSTSAAATSTASATTTTSYFSSSYTTPTTTTVSATTATTSISTITDTVSAFFTVSKSTTTSTIWQITTESTTTTLTATSTSIIETKSATTSITQTSTVYSPTTTVTVGATYTTTVGTVETSSVFGQTITVTYTSLMTSFTTIMTQITSTIISPTVTVTKIVTSTTTGPLIPGGRCLIATATYGSELSPIVQFLRSFRDQAVLSTFAGNQFMTIFNQWYYSFSPTIAQSISSSPALQAVMKILLYPLIAILQFVAAAYAVMSFNPELSIIISGIAASSLIGVVYFAPCITPFLLIAGKRGKLNLKINKLKPLATLSLANVGLILLGEAFASPLLMRFSTATMVILTLTLSALATAMKVTQKMQNC